ncbi:hypothetical protein ANO11243_083540 [Dothideomycetidae sp. 11243]|nr:hypothetical protein ANO11243_083540 [fungal sp. No.11243]
MASITQEISSSRWYAFETIAEHGDIILVTNDYRRFRVHSRVLRNASTVWSARIDARFDRDELSSSDPKEISLSDQNNDTEALALALRLLHKPNGTSYDQISLNMFSRIAKTAGAYDCGASLDQFVSDWFAVYRSSSEGRSRTFLETGDLAAAARLFNHGESFAKLTFQLAFWFGNPLDGLNVDGTPILSPAITETPGTGSSETRSESSADSASDVSAKDRRVPPPAVSTRGERVVPKASEGSFSAVQPTSEDGNMVYEQAREVPKDSRGTSRSTSLATTLSASEGIYGRSWWR